MSNKRLFVERRHEGDWAVRRAGSERASAVERTQKKAIEHAEKLERDPIILVERVKHTNRGRPDHWRGV